MFSRFCLPPIIGYDDSDSEQELHSLPIRGTQMHQPGVFHYLASNDVLSIGLADESNRTTNAVYIGNRRQIRSTDQPASLHLPPSQQQQQLHPDEISQPSSASTVLSLIGEPIPAPNTRTTCLSIIKENSPAIYLNVKPCFDKSIDSTCPICLTQPSCFQTNCRHQFCSCILYSLSNNTNCPMCRTTITNLHLLKE